MRISESANYELDTTLNVTRHDRWREGSEFPDYAQASNGDKEAYDHVINAESASTSAPQQRGQGQNDFESSLERVGQFLDFITDGAI